MQELIQEYDVVRLWDGREGTVVMKYNDDAFCVEIPSEQEPAAGVCIDVTRSDIALITWHASTAERTKANARRIFVLDGAHFSTLEGFYSEIDRLLTKGLAFPTGHNLDAFNDLLGGGFGVHQCGEPIGFVWKNFLKSRQELGDATLLTLIGILLCTDTGHDCTLQLTEE